MKSHEYFMKLAIDEARKADSASEVPVGCVILDPKSEEVVSAGHNLTEILNDATAHAEINAIRELSGKLGRWNLQGYSLYTTLQPCIMCMGAVVNSRIDKIIYGASDPQLQSSNYIYDLENMYPLIKKISIRGNVLKDECSLILSEFFNNLRSEKTTS